MNDAESKDIVNKSIVPQYYDLEHVTIINDVMGTDGDEDDDTADVVDGEQEDLGGDDEVVVTNAESKDIANKSWFLNIRSGICHNINDVIGKPIAPILMIDNFDNTEDSSSDPTDATTDCPSMICETHLYFHRKL